MTWLRHGCGSLECTARGIGKVDCDSNGPDWAFREGGITEGHPSAATDNAAQAALDVRPIVEGFFANGGSASTAVAFSSHVVANAPGCGLCTWSPRDGRRALKFVNQACVLHRDDQVEHD
jgi:hypothetical protein